MKRIGFGGGCHWCTEAVFQFFKGVEKVDQGWIQSTVPYNSFSEAVIVNFDPNKISLEQLLEAHLMTHSSTSNHSLREKYRSALYYFDKNDKELGVKILQKIGLKNQQDYVLKILPFLNFKSNSKESLNYYQKNKEAPFCDRFIRPKLMKLEEKYNLTSKKSHDFVSGIIANK